MSLCSTNERFLTQSLFPITPDSIVRLDGRNATEFRKIDIRLGPGLGQAECTIGQSRTRAVVTGDLIKPPSHRPREGRLSINVEAGPMAAPATLPSGDSSGLVGSSQTPEGVSLCNQLERMLKGSSAVDVEALCVSSGSLVWDLRLDVHILSDCGNLGDSAAIASIVALRHYRKADVNMEDGELVCRPNSDPVPISVHHMPIPVTFAIIPSFSDRPPVLLVDPTSLEEGQGDGGQLVIAINQYGQLCSLLKSGGAPLLLERDVLPAIQLAAARVGTIVELINKKLSEDEYVRTDVHKADIHHKYTTAGLPLSPGFEYDRNAQHRKRRNIAHIEIPKPMEGVDDEIDIVTEDKIKCDEGLIQESNISLFTYSISNEPQESPELNRVVPAAPVVPQPEVAKSDDDDIDDLSAAVLVKPKKKRRPRK